MVSTRRQTGKVIKPPDYYGRGIESSESTKTSRKSKPKATKRKGKTGARKAGRTAKRTKTNVSGAAASGPTKRKRQTGTGKSGSRAKKAKKSVVEDTAPDLSSQEAQSGPEIQNTGHAGQQSDADALADTTANTSTSAPAPNSQPAATAEGPSGQPPLQIVQTPEIASNAAKDIQDNGKTATSIVTKSSSAVEDPKKLAPLQIPSTSVTASVPPASNTELLAATQPSSEAIEAQSNQSAPPAPTTPHPPSSSLSGPPASTTEDPHEYLFDDYVSDVEEDIEDAIPPENNVDDAESTLEHIFNPSTSANGGPDAVQPSTSEDEVTMDKPTPGVQIQPGHPAHPGSLPTSGQLNSEAWDFSAYPPIQIYNDEAAKSARKGCASLGLSSNTTFYAQKLAHIIFENQHFNHFVDASPVIVAAGTTFMTTHILDDARDAVEVEEAFNLQQGQVQQAYERICPKMGALKWMYHPTADMNKLPPSQWAKNWDSMKSSNSGLALPGVGTPTDTAGSANTGHPAPDSSAHQHNTPPSHLALDSARDEHDSPAPPPALGSASSQTRSKPGPDSAFYAGADSGSPFSGTPASHNEAKDVLYSTHTPKIPE